ncbi:hypothetical protein ACOME3_008879 [Neoechinorhynchus agilis]
MALRTKYAFLPIKMILISVDRWWIFFSYLVLTQTIKQVEGNITCIMLYKVDLQFLKECNQSGSAFKTMKYRGTAQYRRDTLTSEIRYRYCQIEKNANGGDYEHTRN